MSKPPSTPCGKAYAAGYNAGLNGPDTTNCNFRHFATPDQKEAWEKGYDDGKKHRRYKVLKPDKA